MRDMFPTSGSRRLETPEDTQELAAELGAALEAGDVVILDGPVGAGKTTFTGTPVSQRRSHAHTC